MKIHEYQAKNILTHFDVPVQREILAKTGAEAESAFDRLGTPMAVVKAQVHAGGRGKGGGVKLVKSAREAGEKASEILSRNLVTPQTGPEGVPVHHVLVCPGVDIQQEYYVGVVIDPNTGPLLMASSEGGVEIEEVARRSPEKIVKEEIDAWQGLQPFQARRVAYRLGFTQDEEVKKVARTLKGISSAFIAYDCSLAEINPLVKTKQGEIIALDAKIVFDDNAFFRHKIYEELKDDCEIHEAEIRAQQNRLSYVRMDGNIGCMVNGAGLAMATMDIIKLAGAEPANFLDVGGGVRQEQVTEAFKIILSDSRVKAILVNIFGGIVHCDVIANGIVRAATEVGLKIPLVVHMEGTHVEEGKRILQNSPWKIVTVSEMEEAAEKVAAAVR